MTNPFASNERTVEQLRGEMRLQRAIVELVPPNNGSNPHTIRVSPRGEGTTETATVITPREGDVQLPSEGDDVLIGKTKSGTTVVLGHLYVGDGQRPPTYEGDRIVSGEKTTTITSGGTTVTVTDDGDVIVGDDGDTVVLGDEDNSSTKRAITDVTAQTTTDVDGHVTSVSVDITRSANVYINE